MTTKEANVPKPVYVLTMCKPGSGEVIGAFTELDYAKVQAQVHASHLTDGDRVLDVQWESDTCSQLLSLGALGPAWYLIAPVVVDEDVR